MAAPKSSCCISLLVVGGWRDWLFWPCMAQTSVQTDDFQMLLYAHTELETNNSERVCSV